MTETDAFVSVHLRGRDGDRHFHMLRSHPRDQIAEAIAATDWKYYERPMPEIYFGHVKNFPGLVIDVGINTGFYAFLAIAASDDNRVLGFEPDSRVRYFLQENISLNQLTDRISVSPLALSDRQGHATLYLPDPGHGLVECSSSLEPTFKGSYSDTVVVGVSQLDDFLLDAAWQGKRVSTIKIDVEGHEREVLNGACRTIAEWRPMIFVEVLTQVDHDALSRMIAGNGYVDVPLRPEGLSTQSEVAFDPIAWNHAFVPAELLEDFLVTEPRRSTTSS